MRGRGLDLRSAAATVAAMENPASQSEIALEPYYAYGYRGRTMMAVRAPFATSGKVPDLVGRIARIDGTAYRVIGISRQISGPIAKGEPIGVEVRLLDPARPTA